MEQSDTAAVSEIFDDQLGDARDELDLELARCYARYHDATKDLTDLEIHSYNQTMAGTSKDAQHYSNIISALFYSILTRPDTARAQMPHLSSINRNNYANLFAKLQTLVMHIRFQQIKSTVRHQILWLLSELASTKANELEGIYLSLFRQVRSGDLSPRNMSFCDQLMRFCESHMRTLENYPRVLAIAVYTYLRMIPDHRSTQFAALQQREIHFVLNLMRTKWPVCCMIGRDLVRILRDVATTVPEIAHFYQTAQENPRSLSPHFQGIDSLLKQPTGREFIRSRLPFDVELRLLWILQNLSTARYQRNLSWFLQRHVLHENYYVDIIRYLVSGWYPSNQILQSDVVPRYVVIGSILRGIKSQTVASNVKLALVFDWLFFTTGDNIMFIEPAMLLMERSAQRYPQITNTIMDFLVHCIDSYHPPLKSYMQECVTCGMRTLLEKGVIRGLLPIYNCQTLDPTTRHHIQRLFDEFLRRESQSARPDLAPNPPSLPMPQAMAPAAPAVAAPSTTRDPRLQAQQQQQQQQQQPQAQLGLTGAAPVAPEEPPRAAAFEQAGYTEDDIDDFLYGNTDATTSTTPGTVTTTDQEGHHAIRASEEPMELADSMASEPSRPSAWDGLSATTGGTPASSVPDIHDLEMRDALEEKGQPGEDEEGEVDMYDDEEQVIEEEEEEGDGVSEEDEEEEKGKEGTSAQGLQKSQSYWIFGDSLDRFQKASQALRAARAAQDDANAIATAHRTTQQCLHDILGVFLRVAIPPQSLAATLAPALRDSVDLPLAPTRLDVQACLNDPALDVLDLVFAFFWEVKEQDAAGTEKLIYLLSGVAACYQKGNQHLIGGRWWYAMARHLQSDASSQDEIDRLQVEWFPVIVDCYESYVSETLPKDVKADEGQRHQAVTDMLTADIKFLAELDLMLFHDLLPFLYHHMPTHCTGNRELLKLACQTILPAQLGRFIGHIQSGLIQPFGDTLLPDLLVDSFQWDAWDTAHLWRVLVAEVQGDAIKTEHLFQHADVVALFRSKDELLPDIHTLFTQTEPTPALFGILLSFSQPTSKTSQTAENVLHHWYYKGSYDALLDTLSQQVDAALADGVSDDGRSLVTFLNHWMRHSTEAGSVPLSESHVWDRLNELASKLDEDWPARP